MPAGYEAGLRVVEHYAGRADASKQSQGIFPHINQKPDIRSGRTIRNRPNLFTGTAAQGVGSVSVKGVRPEGSGINIDAIPQDMLNLLMAFFHNVEYTVDTPGATDTAGDYTSPYTETGIFKFGMLDSRPDISGAVVGTFDPAAGDYNSLVTMSDLYTVGLEWLYGHGDLGDADNALSIDNFVANTLRFEVQRGAEEVLTMGVDGFGRDADEQFDIVEANWGPGINGELSSQSVFAPDSFSLQVLDINSGDEIATFEDWLDSFRLEATNGIGGRDPLGANTYAGILTNGRPSVSVNLGMGFADAGFMTAMVSGYTIALTVRFSNSASEYMDLILPNLRIGEEFYPDVSGPDADATVEVPLIGLIDPTVASPLFEVDLMTEFDVRTNSFFASNTLADASTYTA